MKSLLEQKRIARLKEVREQEKEAAAAIRQKVKKRRDEHVKKVTLKLRHDFEENKENHIHELEEEYNRRLGQFGTAHLLNGLENYGTKVELSEKAISEAQRRYKKAYTKHLHEQNVRTAPVRHQEQCRNKVQKMEAERKEQILALPKPAYDVIANLKAIRVGGLPANSTRTSHETFMITRFHLGESNYTAYPEVVVEKMSGEEQDDARRAAIEEEQRRLVEKEYYDQQIEERKEKAEIRHQYARKDVILKQEKNTLMGELKALEFHHRSTRCETLKNIPKKVFQPPYQRLADVVERRTELEHAFENIYNVNMDNIQELKLPDFVEFKEDDLSRQTESTNRLQSDTVKTTLCDPDSSIDSVINLNTACTKNPSVNSENAVTASQDTSQLVPVAITRANNSRSKARDRTRPESSASSSVMNDYVRNRLASLHEQQRVMNHEIKETSTEVGVDAMTLSEKAGAQVDLSVQVTNKTAFDVNWTNDDPTEATPLPQTPNLTKKDLSVKWHDEISQVDVFIPDADTVVTSPSTSAASESDVTDLTASEPDVTISPSNDDDESYYLREEEPIPKEVITETDKTASLTRVSATMEVPSEITSKSSLTSDTSTSDTSWSLNSASRGHTMLGKETSTQKDDESESFKTNSSDLSLKSAKEKHNESISSCDKRSDESTLSVDRPLSKTMLELQNVRAKKEALRKDYSALIEKMQSYRKELRNKGEQFRKKEAHCIQPCSPYQNEAAGSVIESPTAEKVDVLTAEAITENSIIAEPIQTRCSMPTSVASEHPTTPQTTRVATLSSHVTPHPASPPSRKISATSSTDYDLHEQSGAFSSVSLDISQPEIDFKVQRDGNSAVPINILEHSKQSIIAVHSGSDCKKQSNVPCLSDLVSHRKQSNNSPQTGSADHHVRQSYNIPDDLDTTSESDMSSLNLNPQRRTHELLDELLNDKVDSMCGTRTSTRQQADKLNEDTNRLRVDSDSLRSIESLTDRAYDLQPGFNINEYLMQSGVKHHELLSSNPGYFMTAAADEHHRPSSYNSSGIMSLQEQRLSSAADCSTDSDNSGSDNSDSDSDSDIDAKIEHAISQGPNYDMLLPTSSSSHSTNKLPPLPPRIDNPSPSAATAGRIVTPTEFKPLSCVPSPAADAPDRSLVAELTPNSHRIFQTVASPQPDISSVIPDKTNELSSRNTSLHAMLHTHSLVSGGDSSGMLSLQEQRMSSAAGYLDSSDENGSRAVVENLAGMIPDDGAVENEPPPREAEPVMSPFVSMYDNMHANEANSPLNVSTQFFPLNEFMRTVIDTTCEKNDDNEIIQPVSSTHENAESSFFPNQNKEVRNQMKIDDVNETALSVQSDLRVSNLEARTQSTLHLSHLNRHDEQSSIVAAGIPFDKQSTLISLSSSRDLKNGILLDKPDDILLDKPDDILLDNPDDILLGNPVSLDVPTIFGRADISLNSDSEAKDLSYGLAQLTLNIKELESHRLSPIDLSLEELGPNDLSLDEQSRNMSYNNFSRVDSSVVLPPEGLFLKVSPSEVLSPEVSPPEVSPPEVSPPEVSPPSQEDLLQNITSQDDFVQKYLSPKSSPDNQPDEPLRMIWPPSLLPELYGIAEQPEDPLEPYVDESFAPLTNVQEMSLLSQPCEEQTSPPPSEPDIVEMQPMVVEDHFADDGFDILPVVVNLLSPSVDMLNPEEISDIPVELDHHEAFFKPIELPTIKIQSPSAQLLAKSSSQVLSPSCSFLSDEYEAVLRNMSPELIKASPEVDEDEDVIPGFHGTLISVDHDIEHYSPGSLVITNPIPNTNVTNGFVERKTRDLFQPIETHDLSQDSDQGNDDVLRESHEVQSDSLRLKEQIQVINQLSAQYREEQKKLAESYKKLKNDLLSDNSLSASPPPSICNEDIRADENARCDENNHRNTNENETVSSEIVGSVPMCSTFLNPEREANISPEREADISPEREANISPEREANISTDALGKENHERKDLTNYGHRRIDTSIQLQESHNDDVDDFNHSNLSTTSEKEHVDRKYLSMFDGLTTPDMTLLSKSVIDNETIPLASITDNSYRNLPVIKKYLESIRQNESRVTSQNNITVAVAAASGYEMAKDRDTEATTITDELSLGNDEQRNRFLMSFFQGASPDITLPDRSSTDFDNFSIFDFTQISYRNLPKDTATAENNNENDTSQHAGSSLDADIDKGIRAVEQVFNRHKHNNTSGRISDDFRPTFTQMDSPTYMSLSNNKTNGNILLTTAATVGNGLRESINNRHGSSPIDAARGSLNSDCTMSELTNLKLSSFSNDLPEPSHHAVSDVSRNLPNQTGSYPIDRNPVVASSSKLSKSDSDTSELFTVGKLKLSSQATAGRSSSKKKAQRVKGVARESLSLVNHSTSNNGINNGSSARKSGSGSARKASEKCPKLDKSSSSTTSTCTDESLVKKMTNDGGILQNSRDSLKKRHSSGGGGGASGGGGGGLKKTKQGLVISSQKGGKKQVKFK